MRCAGASRRQRPAGSPPSWGEQTELDVLQRALAQAAARQGQVVALVGEAGVGKSAWSTRSSTHRAQGWRVLESASVSYGKATPYFPIIELLKRYALVERHDDTRTVRAKVTRQVLTLDTALQDLINVAVAPRCSAGGQPVAHARPAPAAPAPRSTASSRCCCAKVRATPAPGLRGSALDRCRDAGAP